MSRSLVCERICRRTRTHGVRHSPARACGSRGAAPSREHGRACKRRRRWDPGGGKHLKVTAPLQLQPTVFTDQDSELSSCTDCTVPPHARTRIRHPTGATSRSRSTGTSARSSSPTRRRRCATGTAPPSCAPTSRPSCPSRGGCRPTAPRSCASAAAPPTTRCTTRVPAHGPCCSATPAGGCGTRVAPARSA